MALLLPAFGLDLANRSGPPKCHHSTPHVGQIIIPHVPDVGRIWAEIMLLSGTGVIKYNTGCVVFNTFVFSVDSNDISSHY